MGAVMKDTIWCCISCILPCGALDVIRIVHASGRVEEIGHSVRAAEVMDAYPMHILRRVPPSSSSSSGSCGGGGERRAAAEVVPPDAELHRGEIYFLVPQPPPPLSHAKGSRAAGAARGKRRRKKKEMQSVADVSSSDDGGGGPAVTERTALLDTDNRYLSEIMSEKAAAAGDHRRQGRAGVWRPRLESISELDL